MNGKKVKSTTNSPYEAMEFLKFKEWLRNNPELMEALDKLILEIMREYLPGSLPLEILLKKPKPKRD